MNKYSYSTDEHQDFYGEFNSPEDAAKAAFYETGCSWNVDNCRVNKN